MSKEFRGGFQSLGEVIAAYESLQALFEMARRQSGIFLDEDAASYVVRPSPPQPNPTDRKEVIDAC